LGADGRINQFFYCLFKIWENRFLQRPRHADMLLAT